MTKLCEHGFVLPDALDFLEDPREAQRIIDQFGLAFPEPFRGELQAEADALNGFCASHPSLEEQWAALTSD